MFTFHVEPAARAYGRVMPECCNTYGRIPCGTSRAFGDRARVAVSAWERRCDAETLRQSERPVIGNSRSRVVWRLLAGQRPCGSPISVPDRTTPLSARPFRAHRRLRCPSTVRYFLVCCARAGAGRPEDSLFVGRSGRPWCAAACAFHNRRDPGLSHPPSDGRCGNTDVWRGGATGGVCLGIGSRHLSGCIVASTPSKLPGSVP